uniref:Uncharacterized protein n=1 Tax=Prolemur simus TaxID=1328070 RepID=A0A8C9DPY4_PROSS
MKLHDLVVQKKCGIFGVSTQQGWSTHLDVLHIIILGGMGLQHQDQESANIVLSNRISAPTFKTHKEMGLVNHIFTEDNLKKLFFLF